MIGPLVSGIGIALIGSQIVLYVDAATFFVSALCLVGVRLRPLHISMYQAVGRGTWSQELMAGVCGTKPQRGSAGGRSTVARIGSGHAGHIDLAGVARSRRLGGALRSMFVGRSAMCGLSLLSAPLIAGACILIISGSTSLFTPMVGGMLQEVTPAPLLGRVFTTFSTGSMAFAMADMAGFGCAADTMGAHVSLLGVGLVLLSTARVTAFSSCKFRRLAERYRTPVAAASQKAAT